MELKPGICIKSSATLDDPNFKNAVILITEYNADGAVGFITNKLYPRKLNELAEFYDSNPFYIFDGGPVDREHLFFIHNRPDVVESGIGVGNGLYVGGNFQQAIAGINTGSMTSDQLKIFIGYCGWDAGELEAEMDEGSWLLYDGAVVF